MKFGFAFFEYRSCHNCECVKPYLIGIAGLSGSGKSELAAQLARRLDSCNTVALDSYYHAHSHLELDARAKLNYDHPDALDWRLLGAHLDALAGGAAIEEPHYSFDLHTRSPRTRTVQPRPFLILEGILTLHRADVRERLDLKIFVETQAEECFRRRLERDVAERGRTPESVGDQYQRTVWPMALEYVLPSRAFADITVSGENPIDQSVAQVMQIIERRGAAGV
jgi:uridine kinase